MRTVIDRSTFLAGADLPREDVPVPEFGTGCVIPVWGMSAGERTRWEQSMLDNNGKQSKSRMLEIRARLAVASCRNDDGTPIFTIADVEALQQKRADIIERIVNVAQRLSGFSNADLETVAKNSEEIQQG